MAELSCWINGCFTVQAVNPDSFRKALVGVPVFCEPLRASVGHHWAQTYVWGKRGKITAFCHVFVLCFVTAAAEF